MHNIMHNNTRDTGCSVFAIEECLVMKYHTFCCQVLFFTEHASLHCMCTSNTFASGQNAQMCTGMTFPGYRLGDTCTLQGTMSVCHVRYSRTSCCRQINDSTGAGFSPDWSGVVAFLVLGFNQKAKNMHLTYM